MRRCLADLGGVEPDQVPLLTPLPPAGRRLGLDQPQPCPDAVAVAWSSERVGVDLERTDRSVPAGIGPTVCIQDRVA